VSDDRPERASGAEPRGLVGPILVALAVMLVWGGTPVFSRIASTQIDPLMVGVLRTVLAGIVALPLVLVMRRPLPATARHRGLLVFSAFAAFIAFPLIYTVGQSYTSVLHGALILATLPVFTSLFGAVVERRRVTALWGLGIAVALLGEIIVIAWRVGDAAAGTSLVGDAIILASSVICAAGYVAGAKLTQDGYPSIATTLWGVALASIVLLPLLGWSVATRGWPQAGPAAWGSVLVLALVTSILGYIAWYWALGRGGISRIASVQFTQPLFGIVLAMVVLGERPGPITLVAAAVILVGVWLVQRQVPETWPDARVPFERRRHRDGGEVG
jgi:drug/metabolite transporter (DMT)-like permease